MSIEYSEVELKQLHAEERARVLSVSAEFNRRYRRHRVQKRVARYLSISAQPRVKFRHQEVA